MSQALQSIESIGRPDEKDAGKSGGARGMTWRDFLQRLTRVRGWSPAFSSLHIPLFVATGSRDRAGVLEFL